MAYEVFVGRESAQITQKTVRKRCAKTSVTKIASTFAKAGFVSLALTTSIATFDIASSGAVAAQADSNTLTLEHYLDWERAGSPQFSPDGKSIIYTRRRIDKFTDKWTSELWQMDANGARHRFLTKGGNVQWAPTGDRIAFVAREGDKAQLKVRHMDAEGAVSVVTRDAMAPIDFIWAPDGKSLAFRAEVPMAPEFKITLPARPKGAKWTEDPLVVERLHYREDRVGNKTGFDHVFVVPADGGTPRQITEGRWDVGARFSGVDASGRLRFLPDGKALIFDGVTDPDKELDGLASAIHRVDVASGTLTQLTKVDGFWTSPLVSPKGRYIAYTGYAAAQANYPPQQVRIMRSDGGEDRALIDNLGADARLIEWAPDGGGLYYSLDSEGTTDLYFVNLQGRSRRVTRGDHRFNVSSIAGGKTAVGVLSSPTLTPNVATVSLSNGQITPRTDLNADILGGVSLGETREISYTSADGTPVQGWYVLPPDYEEGKKYPLVLSIHGGPHAMYGLNFNYRFQEFAANGYVVLFTNPRGSTGYSAQFANAIDNAYPGRADYEDLMGGVDALIETGLVDKQRMFVTGCSGGGVLTTWVVTKTDRFKAAAALCPVTNWISFAGQADIGRWSFARFRPFFWEDPTKWLEHSPIMYVQNVKTPTLLMTGDKDLRTPIEQAEEFYAALKLRGVPTKLIAMRGEYHGTTSIPSNMLRTQLYLRQWFADYGGLPLEGDDKTTPAKTAEADAQGDPAP
ncbi:MAG: S9 family peptidase [Pseudomonadota bacterium]